MLNVILDALALVVVMKAFHVDEDHMGLSIGIAAGAAFAAFVTTFLFVPHVGPAGYLAAGVVVAIGLGCCLNLFLGVPIGKALAVAAIFVVLHAAIAVFLVLTIGPTRRLVLPLGPADDPF